jgi:hypothetical protein
MTPHAMAKNRSTILCFFEKNVRQFGKVAVILQAISKPKAIVIPVSQSSKREYDKKKMDARNNNTYERFEAYLMES